MGWVTTLSDNILCIDEDVQEVLKLCERLSQSKSSSRKHAKKKAIDQRFLKVVLQKNLAFWSTLEVKQHSISDVLEQSNNDSTLAHYLSEELGRAAFNVGI